MVVEKMYIIYFTHIDFIQFFSSNHWIKFILIQMNFEFQNIVMHILKFFLCLEFPENAIKILVYYTPIILVIHHFFG
jgi:hypothetical protein